MSVVHSTAPHGDVARCGKDQEHVTELVRWDDVVNESHPAMPTCSGCIEDIRRHPRPRWLDEHLWPPDREA